MNIEKCIILFSYQGRNILINYILLVLAKYYIYKTKFISIDKNLNIHAFVALLKEKRGLSKRALFCIQPASNFICLMYSLICLHYRVIQDFVPKAPFSEIQAIRKLPLWLKVSKKSSSFERQIVKHTVVNMTGSNCL